MTGKVIELASRRGDPVPIVRPDGSIDWPAMLARCMRRLPEVPAYRGLVNLSAHAMAEQIGREASAAFLEQVIHNLRNPPGAA